MKTPLQAQTEIKTHLKKEFSIDFSIRFSHGGYMCNVKYDNNTIPSAKVHEALSKFEYMDYGHRYIEGFVVMNDAKKRI